MGKRQAHPPARYSASDAPAVPDPGTTGVNDAAEQVAGAAAARQRSPHPRHARPHSPSVCAPPAHTVPVGAAHHPRRARFALAHSPLCAPPSAQPPSTQPPSTPLPSTSSPSAWCVGAARTAVACSVHASAVHAAHVGPLPAGAVLASAVHAAHINAVPAAHVSAGPVSAAAQVSAVHAVQPTSQPQPVPVQVGGRVGHVYTMPIPAICICAARVVPGGAIRASAGARPHLIHSPNSDPTGFTQSSRSQPRAYGSCTPRVCFL
ncbi:hypothetical protein PLICRDRAFT_174020 [Plicaturopsis crispa FD-325 SS-3]|nr:hypothetical protein PLICRDRAFT_174020 [Plicaturopsis crispa FD-325 SS-3]